MSHMNFLARYGHERHINHIIDFGDAEAVEHAMDNENWTLKHTEACADHEDPDVRLVVAGNHMREIVPKHIIDRLKDDPDHSVRVMAHRSENWHATGDEIFTKVMDPNTEPAVRNQSMHWGNSWNKLKNHHYKEMRNHPDPHVARFGRLLYKGDQE